MKKIFKVFTAVSIMLLGVCLFVSCAGKAEDPTDTHTDAPTDEAYVDDFSSFTVFANGSYTTAFVLRENASSLDKQIANKLSAALKEKTGVAPGVLAGSDFVEGRCVYIGDFGKGEAEKIYQALKYGEGKIATSKTSMYICFTNEESGNKMVEDVMAAIDGEGVLKTSNDFASSLTLSTEAVELPAYEGGNQQTLDVGNDSKMLYVSSTSLETYRDYCSELEAEGFKPYGEERVVESNHFATYVKNSSYAYAYYIEAEKEMRVILGPIDMLPELPERNVTESKYQASVSMAGHITPGMCLIFVLPDGRLIVEDGGYNYTDKGTPDAVYKAIKKVAPDPKNIVIAAWILSHPHDDHQDAFVEFVDAEHKDVKIESLVYSYNAADTYIRSVTDDWSQWVEDANYCANVLKEKQGTKIIKAHTGQLLHFGDVQIEVMQTAEDIVPGSYDNINSTSLILRMYIEDHAIMLLGDTTPSGGTLLEKVWGDYIASDIVQMEHHGIEVWSPQLYLTINADVILWPGNKSIVKNYMNESLRNALSCAEDVYLAGDVPGEVITVKLPHTIENNKQAFLDACGIK